MCGIAGIVGTESGMVVEAETIHRMCQTLVHRGPDDEGIYTNDGVGLGMRRLSIIDLAGGHQPVHNEDKTVWVVFNGEIYNFPWLRRELEKRGHRFYTNSDTEVIVHLYEDFGADCVRNLRGMFAFALYDERRRRLLLARDRLGIKPLHHAVKNGRLLFGSEIKAILAAAPELKEINNQSLLQYLHFGYIPQPLTAFADIQKLAPGHVLELENGNVKISEYWDIPAYGTHQPRSEEECLEELETRLAEAVRIRLTADVPLGALLSGGTDSSIVVALMARASSKPVETFSIGFGSHDFDERSYARLVANRFGTNHHEFVVDPEMEETLHELTSSLEEPFGDSSMVPTYHVSRLARQHVTVALSGDGGDELFGGYDRYRTQLRRRPFNLIPDWAGRWYRKSVFARLPSEWYGRNFLFNISLPWPDCYLDSVTYLPAYREKGSLFTDDFLATANGGGKAPLESYLECVARAPAGDPLSQLLYLDTKTYLPSDILTKVDRMSMLRSLEVRVPLLDHVFLEWVAALPAHWKLRNGREKYILKKLGERLGVPSEVLHRPKQGFAMPLVHWMRRELKADLFRLLLEPRAIQRGYFKPDGVKRLLDEHLSGRRDHAGRLWILLALELWHRNFLDAQGGVAASLASTRCVNVEQEVTSFSDSTAGVQVLAHRGPSAGGAEPAPKSKAPVFVVGCPRSGTTLLYHMLLSAGGFAVYRAESNVFNLLMPRFGDLGVRKNRQQLVSAWLQTKMFAVSGLDATQIEAKILEECRDYGDFLRITMGEIAARQNVHRWADCTPQHLLYMQAIKESFPDALIIHMIRDGRDVALSLDKLGWVRPLFRQKKQGLMAAALYWKWIVTKGRENAGRGFPDYMEVRFEELVTEPRRIMAEVGRFIDHNLDYNRIQEVAIGTVSEPNTSFEAERLDGEFSPIGRWKKLIPPQDVVTVQRLVGDLLVELGYPLAVPSERLSRNWLGIRAKSAFNHLRLDAKEWAKTRTRLNEIWRREVAVLPPYSAARVTPKDGEGPKDGDIPQGEIMTQPHGPEVGPRPRGSSPSARRD